MFVYKKQVFTAIGAGLLLLPAATIAAQQSDDGTSQPAEAETGETAAERPVSGVDRAYQAPVTVEPDLPVLPQPPILSEDGYPDCREDFQKIAAPFDKAADTNRCTTLLDAYYAEILVPFRQAMIDHQNALSELYTSQVAGRMEYSAQNRDDFYKAMMDEHAKSDPDGAYLESYRTLEARYQQDRVYLQDRFCFNTGCGGYPVPEYVAAEPDEKKADKKARQSARKGKGPKQCKKSRKRGGLIGGLLGGVAGDAAGLGTIGSLIASGAGAVLVSEIACQLTKGEQEKAVAATEAVTEKEEVGAVATWKSPTRAGVSGSSTVTALNTEPSGRKCLSITDVAIIDGVETRISKQMCRGSGEDRYTILA